jgi:hypothetical protein
MREIASAVRAAAPLLKTDLNSSQLINMNMLVLVVGILV